MNSQMTYIRLKCLCKKESGVNWDEGPSELFLDFNLIKSGCTRKKPIFHVRLTSLYLLEFIVVESSTCSGLVLKGCDSLWLRDGNY